MRITWLTVPVVTRSRSAVRPKCSSSASVRNPSARVTGDTIIDLVRRERARSNVDHPCLVVAPLDWDEVIASGIFTVLEGPVGRFGARGNAVSVYVADPDGNTVELRWYPADR